MALLPGGIDTAEGTGTSRFKGRIRSWKNIVWHQSSAKLMDAGAISSPAAFGSPTLRRFNRQILVPAIASAQAFGSVQVYSPGGSSVLDYLIANERYSTEWDNVGVDGGISRFRDGGANARPLGVNVTAYGADPTGASDCTSAFTAAMNACPSGAYIYIPNGTYRVSGLIYPTSNRTWRGQSPTGTRIVFTGGGGFQVNAQWPPPTIAANGVAVTAGATRGSNVLTVASVGSFSVGGLVQLTSLTKSYMHHNTANNWTAQEWFGYDATRLASIMFMVTAIDSGNRRITLSHALPLDMNDTPILMPRAVNITGLGFENLWFDCSSSTSNQVIWIVNATNCWIYNCYFENLYDRSAWFEECVRITVEHCYSDHGQGLGRNCEGLDFYGNACWCLVQDNVFHSAGYPMIIFGDFQGGCVGNVAAYNFQNGFRQGYDLSTFPLTMDDSHGPHCMFNLWEGNVGEVFGTDGYYGGASHGVYYRNRIWGTTSEMDYADQTCFELNHWSYKYTIIGNILGTPAGSSWNTTGRRSQIYEASGGSPQEPQIYRLGYPDMGNRGYTGTGDNPTNPSYLDTGVKNTLLRHRNYDYVTLGIVDDPSLSLPIPASLYLSAKPSWFGSLNFPAIGPDVGGYTTDIPAQRRWSNYLSSGNLADLFAAIP